MKKQEFISLSKNMVKEYLNVFNDKTGQILSVLDVQVEGFHDTPENYRILLSVPSADGFYYEVIYDKKTTGVHSYVFKKAGKRIVGKKVNTRKVIA